MPRTREDERRRLEAEAAATSFDLARGPLLDPRLLALSEQEHVLLLTVHHIVADGVSMEVILREVTALYGAATANQPSTLPEPVLQYADYALHQRDGRLLASAAAYWREKLSGEIPFLDLPTDFPRPAVQTFRGATAASRLDAETTRGLKALGNASGATLFMTLLAAFDLLLCRLTGHNDVLVGAPVAGRGRAELEGLVGIFLNTLVLRTHVDLSRSFNKLLSEVRETALGAYAHQDLPFEQVLREVRPERDLSHTPLFQVFFP